MINHDRDPVLGDITPDQVSFAIVEVAGPGNRIPACSLRAIWSRHVGARQSGVDQRLSDQSSAGRRAGRDRPHTDRKAGENSRLAQPSVRRAGAEELRTSGRCYSKTTPSRNQSATQPSSTYGEHRLRGRIDVRWVRTPLQRPRPPHPAQRLADTANPPRPSSPPMTSYSPGHAHLTWRPTSRCSLRWRLVVVHSPIDAAFPRSKGYMVTEFHRCWVVADEELLAYPRVYI